MSDERAAVRVETLIDSMGRQISDESPHRPALAESFAALTRLGADHTPDDRIALAERAVFLTVLF
ncbi:hypothetical protein ACGFXB_09640 [Streptomyces canus]|jgi:hypothetical protein|uniref:hypothetical protein n=1 Tax=Streptomyces canus TaxID=58343 RepID=UPI00371F879F